MITKVGFSQNGIQNKQSTTNNAVLPKQRQHDPSFGMIHIDLKHLQPDIISERVDTMRSVLPDFNVNPITPGKGYLINALCLIFRSLEELYQQPILMKCLHDPNCTNITKPQKPLELINKLKQGFEEEQKLYNQLKKTYRDKVTTDHTDIQRVLNLITQTAAS